MRKRDVWRIDQFHLMKKIGSGYASTVYLATCRTTGNQVAVKLYHKSKLSELNHFQISREVRIHGVLDHKHIVQLWAAFEDQYGIYLITEYASKGDVFTEVERRGGQMTEAEAVRQVIYPFLTALDYLHSRHIIHRDIKPENLLFTATGVLKVGDFGLSINTSEERPVTRVGTLDYMAPEVVVCPDKHKPSDHKEMTHLVYTHLIDAWAVGVLAYELIVGKPPFDKGQKRATVQEILHGQPALPAWLSEGAAHFMVWALCKEQSRRPSVPQLMQHPWLLAHMQGPPHLHAQLGRALGRTESFGERGTAATARGSGSPASVVQHLQVQSVQMSGRLLASSSSMSALDGMRFRDLLTFETEAAALGAAAPKRNSDGLLGTPGASARPSLAAGMLASGLTPITASASPHALLLSAASSLSRQASLNRQRDVLDAYLEAHGHGPQALAMGALSPSSSPHASQRSASPFMMSREEMISSLRTPLSPRAVALAAAGAGGGGGAPVSLHHSFTMQKSHSLVLPPTAPGRNSPRPSPLAMNSAALASPSKAQTLAPLSPLPGVTTHQPQQQQPQQQRPASAAAAAGHALEAMGSEHSGSSGGGSLQHGGGHTHRQASGPTSEFGNSPAHSPQPHSTPRSFDPTPPPPGDFTRPLSCLAPPHAAAAGLPPLLPPVPAAATLTGTSSGTARTPPLTLVVPPMSRRTTDACAPDHSPVLGTGSGSTSPTGSGGSSCAAGCLEHRTDALLGGVLEGALPPSKPSPARPGGLAELAGWVDSDGGATGLGSAKARGGAVT
ncbi:MAG: hypothetical protein WDW38_003213 [Sanguina aurantia]